MAAHHKDSFFGKENITIQDIMKSPALKIAFKSFLKNELSQENFDFYADVEHLHQVEDVPPIMGTREDMIAEICWSIYNGYFQEGKAKEINIEGSVKQKVIDLFKKARSNPDLLSTTVFDEAQQAIFFTLRSDAFMRFKKTVPQIEEQIKLILNEKEQREKSKKK